MKSITKKSQDIKQQIASELYKELSNDSFQYNKTFNEFRCIKNEFTFIFNIEQVAWKNSYSLHVKLYISQKAIEFVLESIIGKQRHKLTIGNEIDKIYKSPDGREVVNGDLSIWIREDADIEAAIESLLWYYNHISKLYFSKYNTLYAIDNIINNSPFDYCPAHVGGNFDERCMKGLIVARLVGNPKYEKLVEVYDQAIKETMDHESINNYSKVREFLMYNRLSQSDTSL